MNQLALPLADDRPNRPSPPRREPDLVLHPHPRRQLVTVTGPEAYRAVSAITDVFSHSTTFGGWIVGAQHVADLYAYAQAHRLLLVRRERIQEDE